MEAELWIKPGYPQRRVHNPSRRGPAVISGRKGNTVPITVLTRRHSSRGGDPHACDCRLKESAPAVAVRYRIDIVHDF